MAETEESDYDLILVAKFDDLKQVCQNVDNFREEILFEKIAEKLNQKYSLEHLEIYKIRSAKVPIIKFNYN